jgi:hypothetical protein
VVYHRNADAFLLHDESLDAAAARRIRQRQEQYYVRLRRRRALTRCWQPMVLSIEAGGLVRPQAPRLTR